MYATSVCQAPETTTAAVINLFALPDPLVEGAIRVPELPGDFYDEVIGKISRVHQRSMPGRGARPPNLHDTQQLTKRARTSTGSKRPTAFLDGRAVSGSSAQRPGEIFFGIYKKIMKLKVR